MIMDMETIEIIIIIIIGVPYRYIIASQGQKEGELEIVSQWSGCLQLAW